MVALLDVDGWRLVLCRFVGGEVVGLVGSSWRPSRHPFRSRCSLPPHRGFDLGVPPVGCQSWCWLLCYDYYVAVGSSPVWWEGMLLMVLLLASLPASVSKALFAPPCGGVDLVSRGGVLVGHRGLARCMGLPDFNGARDRIQRCIRLVRPRPGPFFCTQLARR